MWLCGMRLLRKPILLEMLLQFTQQMEGMQIGSVPDFVLW
jgi:hypothetical protein